MADSVRADSRDTIDGCKVIAREAARMISPLSRNGKPSIYRGIDKVLLEDGREVYQCTKSETCFFWRNKMSQVWPHLKVHAYVKASVAKAQRSNAGKAAQRYRAQRLELLIDDEARREWLKRACIKLAEMEKVLLELSRLKVPPTVDPQELAELRAKAAKWDAFMEMTRS